MATPPNNTGTGSKPLPSIPSASNLTMNTYVNPTSPVAQRLQVNAPVIGPATGNQRYVYMGTVTAPRPAGIPYKNPAQMRPTQVARLVPITDARYMMETLAPAERKKLNDATTAYFGHNRWDPSWQDGVWERAINISANSYAYGGESNAITPVDAFGLVIQNMQGSGGRGGRGGGGGGGGGYSGPVTTVQTTKSVNLTNPTEARTLVNKALSDYLGREATGREQQNFLKALNFQERRNPSVTRQRSTTTPQGVAMNTVESEVMSQGGFNPSTFAQEYAQGQEGAAEFQAATNLLDTFIGALKARV